MVVSNRGGREPAPAHEPGFSSLRSRQTLGETGLKVLVDLFSDMFPDRVLPNELLLLCFDKFRW